MTKSFSFGKNWKNYLQEMNEERIREAESALLEFLGRQNLQGMTFLDVGSGSGLMSLVARRLGAWVCSIDVDSASVECTMQLKARYFPDDANWTIKQASILDEAFIRAEKTYDIVYSWGVLHHTGDLWTALSNAMKLVGKNGFLFISIYNHQPLLSRFWEKEKRLYNQSSPSGRVLLRGFWLAFFGVYGIIGDLIQFRNPLRRHSSRHRRGMSFYHDVVDWIGGWPFETALPEAVFRFCHTRGFALTNLKTVGGKMGCNEFLFRKSPETAR